MYPFGEASPECTTRLPLPGSSARRRGVWRHRVEHQPSDRQHPCLSVTNSVKELLLGRNRRKARTRYISPDQSALPDQLTLPQRDTQARRDRNQCICLRPLSRGAGWLARCVWQNWRGPVLPVGVAPSGRKAARGLRPGKRRSKEALPPTACRAEGRTLPAEILSFADCLA